MIFTDNMFLKVAIKDAENDVKIKKFKISAIKSKLKVNVLVVFDQMEN